MVFIMTFTNILVQQKVVHPRLQILPLTFQTFITRSPRVIHNTMKQKIARIDASETKVYKKRKISLLSANPTKWSNTLKQFDELFECV